MVTLAVTPNEVEALSYLVNSGKPFQMVLKNPLEIGKDVVTIGTTEKMVMDAILKGGFSKDDKSARGPAEVSIPPVEPIVTVKVENQKVTLPPQLIPIEPERVVISYGSEKKDFPKDGLVKPDSVSQFPGEGPKGVNLEGQPKPSAE